MSTNPLDRITEGRCLPEGCDTWGIKSVHPWLRTRNDFQWPASGWVTVPSDGIDQENTSPCPSRPGDGLCVANTWKGMASGGIPARTLLLVAYSSADVLGGDDHKVRVSRVCVVEVLDGTGVLAPGDDLRGAYLPGVDLRRANLSGADLTGAALTDADLTGATLTGVNLLRADLRRAALAGATLAGADLTCANLADAGLTNADLTDANLWRANLTDADLTCADLSGANLGGVNLSIADLTDANVNAQ